MKYLLLFLSCAAMAAGITLEWDANPEQDIFGYTMEQRTGNGPWVQIQSTSETWIDVDGLTAGRHSFRVRAVNTQGLTSEPSDELVVAVPDKPGGLRIRLALQSSNDLRAWDTLAEFEDGAAEGTNKFYRLAITRP